MYLCECVNEEEGDGESVGPQVISLLSESYIRYINFVIMGW